MELTIEEVRLQFVTIGMTRPNYQPYEFREVLEQAQAAAAFVFDGTIPEKPVISIGSTKIIP